MYYYNVLINLFESLAVAGLENSDFSTLAQRTEKTPQEVVLDARIRLETLLRLYYLRHSFEALDAHLIHFFALLGFMSLNDIKTDVDSPIINDQRSLLILCLKGLRDQGQCFYFGQSLFCLMRDGMRPEDDDLLKRYVDVAEIEKNQLRGFQQVRSQYAINVVGIDDNPENQRVSDLVKEYLDLTLDSVSESSLNP